MSRPSPARPAAKQQNVTADTTGATFTCSATSAGGSDSKSVTIQRDATVPLLGDCPAGGPFTLNSGVQAVGPISVDAAVSGLNPAAGSLNGSVDTSSVGAQSVTFSATDLAGNSAGKDCTYSVQYSFTGFMPPLDNIPVLNQVKAGQAIPVKFSLSGNQGLNILASGSPSSLQITCPSGVTVDSLTETVAASASSITYDAASDQYVYVWKTDKGWANTCRQLNVALADGTIHIAGFQFTK